MCCQGQHYAGTGVIQPVIHAWHCEELTRATGCGVLLSAYPSSMFGVVKGDTMLVMCVVRDNRMLVVLSAYLSSMFGTVKGDTMLYGHVCCQGKQDADTGVILTSWAGLTLPRETGCWLRRRGRQDTVVQGPSYDLSVNKYMIDTIVELVQIRRDLTFRLFLLQTCNLLEL